MAIPSCFEAARDILCCFIFFGSISLPLSNGRLPWEKFDAEVVALSMEGVQVLILILIFFLSFFLSGYGWMILVPGT
jgi:hypothetical protein